MSERQFRERIASPFASATVDREKGFIDDLVLLGNLSSDNGYDYDEKDFRERVAAGVYSGAQLFEDHLKEDETGQVRPYRELVGTVVSARFDESDKKVKGRVAILTSRESGRALLEQASRPELQRCAGMSHDASGRLEEAGSGGGRPRAFITRINSVDVVTRPATTRGLFESAGRPAAPNQENEMDAKNLKEMSIADLLRERPDVKDHVLREAKTGDETAALREQIKTKDAELKTLRETAAKNETTALVEKRTEKMPAKVAKIIRDRFKDKIASADDVDAYLTEAKELLEAAGASAKVVTGAGPTGIVAKDDDDEEVGMSLDELRESFACGRTLTKTGTDAGNTEK